jgi:hypothetical protein
MGGRFLTISAAGSIERGAMHLRSSPNALALLQHQDTVKVLLPPGQSPAGMQRARAHTARLAHAEQVGRILTEALTTFRS